MQQGIHRCSMATLCTSMSLLIRHQRLTSMLPDHILPVSALPLYLGHHPKNLHHLRVLQMAELVSTDIVSALVQLIWTLMFCHRFTSNPDISSLTRSVFHSELKNPKLGSLANLFLHRPFPFLPDWFYRLSDYLMFLFCSMAGFFFAWYVRLSQLLVGFRIHLISMHFHFISFIHWFIYPQL